MLEIITLLMLILGGLVLSSRAEAVAYNEKNPKPREYVKEFIEDCYKFYRGGLGWEKDF